MINLDELAQQAAKKSAGPQSDLLDQEGLGRLKTAWNEYRDEAASRNKGGGKSRLSMAELFERAGVDPKEVLDIPTMDAAVSPEDAKRYQATVDSILNASVESGVRNGASISETMETLLEYQQHALQEAASNVQTLSDPEATEQQKQQARLSLGQLATSDMGDAHDKNSPLAGFKEKRAAYFEDDARLANMTPEEKAQYLDDPEQLGQRADEFMVGDKVDQRGKAYRDRNDAITRERATVEDIGARTVGDEELLSGLGLERTVGDDELVDPRIAAQIVSAYEDPDFLEKIDRTGQQAMGRSIDYFDELIANDGKDAVSEAFMNRATRQAEMRRKANVDAALANLDARGMGGSGSELQAYLQGAGQSMQAQFDAAMEAAAMQQQRRDAAAEQRAVIGEARQLLADGQAQTMAEAIDLATRERAALEEKTATTNATTASNAADKTFDWRTNAAEKDAATYTGANDLTYKTDATRVTDQALLDDSAFGDEYTRAGQVEDNVFETGLKGVVSDAGTRKGLAEADRAFSEAGKLAAVGQGNEAITLAIQQQVANQGEPQDVTGWDIVGAGAELLPGGVAAVKTIKDIADDEDD